MGMRGMPGIRGIRVGMQVIRVGMLGIRLGMRGIRVRMRGIRVKIWGIRWQCRESACRNAGNQGRNMGNQGNSLWESKSARGAFHNPAFMDSCPTISHTFFALRTKWMSPPSRKWGRGKSKISYSCICVWCESGELGCRRSSRFPYEPPVVETFSSDRVIFRIPSNINDRAPLWKQQTALARRLFLQKSSTIALRPDSKCGSDWRCCECRVWVNCKCMEFVATGCYTKKWLRFD